MKNTIPASEIKRRGIGAVEPALKRGPVEVISRNRPRYVILSQEQYRRLVSHQENINALWDTLLEDTEPGTRSANDIRRQIEQERAGWTSGR